MSDSTPLLFNRNLAYYRFQSRTRHCQTLYLMPGARRATGLHTSLTGDVGDAPWFLETTVPEAALLRTRQVQRVEQILLTTSRHGGMPSRLRDRAAGRLGRIFCERCAFR